MRISAALIVIAFALVPQAPKDWRLEVTQLTRGPMHHFFGYIGQARTIPWNEGGRYVVALRTPFQDRMPKPGEPADVVLIDTTRGNQVEVIDQSRGWNPQQGTMFYWNPAAPATQVFFNDRDPQTQKIFTVLYDVSGAPAACANTASTKRPWQQWRRAEWRPVSRDQLWPSRGCGWSPAIRALTTSRRTSRIRDDGISCGGRGEEARAACSCPYKQLADHPVRPPGRGQEGAVHQPHAVEPRRQPYLFLLRAEFDEPCCALDIPSPSRPDGSGLTMHPHTGGHPEWESGRRVIGAEGRGRSSSTSRAGVWSRRSVRPRPFRSRAATSHCRRTASGLSTATATGGNNYYTVLRRADGSWARTAAISAASPPAANCASTARRPGTAPVTRSCSRVSIRPTGRGRFS